MKLKFFWIVSLLAAVSCTGEFDFREMVSSGLEIDADRMVFGSDAAQASMGVRTSESWSAVLSEPCDWLTVVSDASSITVGVLENNDVLSRTATILVKSASRTSRIRVSQSGRDGTVTVSSDTLVSEYKAYSEVITVDAGLSWTAYAPASWISTSIDGNKLKVDMTENPGDSRRSSYILIQNNGLTLKRIFVSQASSVPPVPEYYNITISDVDWDESRVFFATNQDADTIAVLTREFLGIESGKAAEFLYPFRSGEPDFTTRTKAESGAFWIKKDGSAFFTYNPASRFDAVEPAGLEVLGLESDVKTHGSVKVGSQIWLMEDYKTTKLADGTSLTISYENGAYDANSKTVAIYTDKNNIEHYLYTGACLKGFAPEGWSLPSPEDYLQTLLVFVGSYEALTGVSQFGATSNYKCTKSKTGTATFTALNYTNTWSSKTSGTTKQYMVGLNPNGGNVNSAQALTGCFSIRLIKK